MPDNQGTSTRPYLLRALHAWCTDNGFTPYIAVHVGVDVQVPMEYVKNNEIVLNIGFEATSSLDLGNERVHFRARFGGVTREISVPVGHVIAIYARENGQGMAFPMPSTEDLAAAAKPPAAPALRLASVDGAGAGKTQANARSRVKLSSAKPVDARPASQESPDSPDQAATTPPKPTRALHSAKTAAPLGATPAAAKKPVRAVAEGESDAASEASGRSEPHAGDKPEDKPPAGSRPTLKRVK